MAKKGMKPFVNSNWYLFLQSLTRWWIYLSNIWWIYSHRCGTQWNRLYLLEVTRWECCLKNCSISTVSSLKAGTVPIFPITESPEPSNVSGVWLDIRNSDRVGDPTVCLCFGGGKIKPLHDPIWTSNTCKEKIAEFLQRAFRLIFRKHQTINVQCKL